MESRKIVQMNLFAGGTKNANIESGNVDTGWGKGEGGMNQQS